MAARLLPATAGAERTFDALLPRRSAYRFWPRYARNRGAVLGLVLLGTLVILALLGPILYRPDPQATNLAATFTPPSPAYPLGTDNLGRDILARLLHGARYSLAICVASVSLALAVSIPLGAASGYYGGWADLLIMRLVEILLSFPGFLLALVLVAVLGVGLQNVVISAGLGAVPGFVRLVRAQSLSARYEGYVDVALGLGARDVAVIYRHVLPNTMPALIVQSTLGLASTLLTAAGLGFLGFGVQQPTPEWGAMLGEGRQFILSNPNLATFSGLAISAAVLSMNLVGDGLRDALDPLLFQR